MARGKGDFFPRSEILQKQVGDGILKGRVEFDQIYAWNQHEGGWINFMGRYGAKRIKAHPQSPYQPPSKFLENPTKQSGPEFAQRLADAVLEGRLIEEMASCMEDLSADAEERAPVLFRHLQNSGHPQVYDDAQLVYDRAPRSSRQIKTEPFQGVPEGYYE
jgi:hypothetical protein